MSLLKGLPRGYLLLGLLFSTGCASLEGESFKEGDRHEEFNRASFRLSEAVDERVMAPAARGYDRIVPGPVKRGVLNAFHNLRALDSALNGLLQGKIDSAATDLARFGVNSSLGLLGWFDVAARWKLEDQQEDLGQTLAVWGVTGSSYLYVPLLGPSTWRDLPSMLVSNVMPRLVLGPNYHWSLSGLDVLGTRADFLTATQLRDSSALDPYAFTRDAYLQRRKFLIYDGNPPLEDFFDDFDD